MHLSIALVADALERSRLAALPGREQAEHNGDPLPSYADCWSSNRGITAIGTATLTCVMTLPRFKKPPDTASSSVSVNSTISAGIMISSLYSADIKKA
jgi:hypothetical protein